MIASIGLGLLVTAVTTLALLLLRPVLVRRLPDVATARSSHVGIIPRGGGAAVLIGVVTGMLVVTGTSNTPRVIILATSGVLCFAVLGLLEDVVGLSIGLRLIMQTLIAGACAVGAAVLADLPLTVTGSLIIAVLAATGIFYVNAANFVDGINGISSVHGLIVGVYFAALGALVGSQDLTLAGATVAAAFAAFLPWNVPRPALFLGDVGSYLLGGSVWLLALGGMAAGVSVAAAVFPLAIYAVDVTLTLIRRALRGVRVFDAHREHVYQRLQQATGSHSVAAAVCALATGLCLLAGWQVQTGLDAAAGSIFVLVIALVYVCSPGIVLTGRELLRGGT